jgi:hypothetical protein
MPNIFDGLEKAQDKDLIEQIAILESINITNILKPYGTKFQKGAIKAINKISDLFGKNLDIQEPQQKELMDYINDTRLRIKDLPRNELNNLLINSLAKKLNLESNDTTLDTISVKAIDEAAELFNIPTNLTPAQKADGIHRRFNERMLENIQKNLKKQNPDAIDKTVKALDKNIDEMSEEQKKQIKDALNIEELTGETIRDALLKAGAPAAIMATISLSGFGAFLALTTVLHAIFTTMLGITLPFAVYTGATSFLSIITGPIGLILVAGVFSYQIFNGNRKLDRELFAQIIWFSITTNGNYFTPKDDSLPSWVQIENVAAVEKDELEFKKLIQEKEAMEKIVKDSHEKLNKLQSKIFQQSKNIEEEKVRRSQAELRVAELTTSKNELFENQKRALNKIKHLESELELKGNVDLELQNELIEAKALESLLNKQLDDVNKNLIYQNQVLEIASNEIDAIKEKKKELEESNKKLLIENEEYRRKAEIENTKVEYKEQSKRQEILERWSSYFSEFEFEPRSIRDVVRFSRAELLTVEKSLMELYYTNDPRALSRGKIKELSEDYDHLGLSFPDGFPTRVLYKVLSSSQNPRVRIVRIYKHNEKFLK